MSDRENERPDDQMKCVYMGPPMKKSVIASLREKIIGKKPEKKTPYPQSFADEKDPEEEPHGPDPSAIEGVYAGPGMMSGPKNVKERSGAKRPRMEALYAAPRRPDASRMMMVYAGPDYFANNKNSQTPMMAAYAGPSVDMSMTLAERMAAAQKEAEEQYRNGKLDYSKETQDPGDLGKETVCPGCGTTVLQARFCSECGAALPGSLMVKCPTCGSIVPKLKFCGECGAMFPKEEESNAPSPAEESGPEA